MSAVLHFRVDGGSRVGMGHLNRCLALARVAGFTGMRSRFTVFGDDTAAALIAGAGYLPTVRKRTPLSQQADEVPFLSTRDEVSILDLVHSATLADTPAALAVLAAWRRHSRVAVLIDGAAGQGLRGREKKLDVDVVVAPYAGEPAATGEPYELLAGPEYAVLDPSFAALPRRRVRSPANRVLISCGGADPLGLTAILLHAMESVRMHLEIDVVIGPLFEHELAARIAGLSRASRHRVSLSHGLSNLARAMAAVDVAICTSGLLKYELAASGTPGLLIAADRAHLDADQPFIKAGTVHHLGTVDDLRDDSLATRLAGLLADALARQEMADRGQRLVDGRGTQRVIAALAKYASM